MEHLTFFICILSLCTGMVSLAVSWLFYKQHNKKVIISYMLMLLMVLLLAVGRMAELYAYIIQSGDNSVVKLFVGITEKIAFTFGLFAGPIFCYQLIRIPMNNKSKLLFRMVTLLYVLFAVTEIAASGSNLSRIVHNAAGLPLLFGTFGAVPGS